MWNTGIKSTQVLLPRRHSCIIFDYEYMKLRPFFKVVKNTDAISYEQKLYGCTGPKTPFEHAFDHAFDHFSSRPMPGQQTVDRSPTCGHFQEGHMVAEWSDPQ